LQSMISNISESIDRDKKKGPFKNERALKKGR
jgi:hypothetical protein